MALNQQEHTQPPPPSYTSTEVWGASLPQEKQPPLEKQPQPQPLTTLSRLPPHHNLDARGTHILHFYRDSLVGRDLTIVDSDKTTVAYTVSANHGTLLSQKPHMRIYRGPVEHQSSTQPVGTATFHTYSRTIDLDLHGRPACLEATGLFGVKHQFMSGMGPLNWKSDGWGSDLILMTPGKEWLAKFDRSSFSIDKRGKLEVVNWDIRGVALDEIVVSGLAMMEYMRRRRNNS